MKIPVKKGHYCSCDIRQLRCSSIDERIRKFEKLRKPLKYNTAGVVEGQRLHHVISIHYVKGDEAPSYKKYQPLRNDEVG